jgi:hypothetical protein
MEKDCGRKTRREKVKSKIKKVVRIVLKYAPKIFTYTFTGFTLCAVGVILCSLLGITVECIAKMPIYLLPIYTIGAISTSLVIYKGFDDGIDTFIASFVLGLIWPIVVTISGIVFVLNCIPDWIEKLDNWSKEENKEGEQLKVCIAVSNIMFSVSKSIITIGLSFLCSISSIHLEKISRCFIWEKRENVPDL